MVAEFGDNWMVLHKLLCTSTPCLLYKYREKGCSDILNRSDTVWWYMLRTCNSQKWESGSRLLPPCVTSIHFLMVWIIIFNIKIIMHGCSSSTGKLDWLSFQWDTVNVSVICHCTFSISAFLNQILYLFITNPFNSCILSFKTLKLSKNAKNILVIQHVWIKHGHQHAVNCKTKFRTKWLHWARSIQRS
jgi:hypothetical protein